MQIPQGPIHFPGAPRFEVAPAGTPGGPDLSTVGPGRAPVSLQALQVEIGGQPLVSLGGDYWAGTTFPLGPCYAFDAGDVFVGPFALAQPILTFRATVDPGVHMLVDVWVYSPQTLSPPWADPAPAVEAKPTVAARETTASQGRQVAASAPGGVQLQPGAVQRPPFVPAVATHTDSYGRQVMPGEPYCLEQALSATAFNCGPWQQFFLDASAFVGAAVYVRLSVTGTGSAYIDCLKQVDVAPAGLDPTDPAPPVWGLADLHSHPMAFMGMGGHFVSGSYTATSADPADLAHCDADHSRGPLDLVINNFPDGHQAGGRDGGNTFGTWPSSLEGIHQQMHPAWIRRAWEGGLRLLVALVINTELLATLHSITSPTEWAGDHGDTQAIIDQITFFDQVIANNSGWMEMAATPADARRIINGGKLAIIYGIEVDSFLGMWMNDAGVAPATASPGDIYNVVKERLQELYDTYHVRQLNPVHLANNAFGGCSIYQDLFNLNNLTLNMEWLVPEAATPDIDFRLSQILAPWVEALLGGLAPELGEVAATLPQYDAVAPGQGHQNSLGANPRIAAAAVNAMMDVGMIIDVDHMGNHTAGAVLDQCAGVVRNGVPYPVVSAHSQFRAVLPRKNWSDPDHPTPPGQRKAGDLWPHESAKSDDTAQQIVALGGVLSPITAQHDTVSDSLLGADPPVATDCSGSSKSYAQELRHAAALSAGRGIGIGTDMTLIAQVGPRFGPLAGYGLSGEGGDGASERRNQAFLQANGVIYSTPVQGQSRFFNPPQVDAGGKLNPYMFPQDAAVDLKIGGEYAFANDVWKALWLHESGADPVDADSAEVHDMTRGFGAALADAASLDGLARTSCELMGGTPLSSLTDPGDPTDPRRQQQVISDAILMWSRMRIGGNVPLVRCVAGQYSFDFNVDGLAHYGLVPDLLQDLSNVGVGPTTLNALFSSAEAYIQVWEQCERHRALPELTQAERDALLATAPPRI